MFFEKGKIMWQFISAVLFVVATSMISHYLIKRSLIPWNGEMFLISNHHEQKPDVSDRLVNEFGAKFGHELILPTGFHRDINLPKGIALGGFLFSNSTCGTMPFVRIVLKKGSELAFVAWRVVIFNDEVTIRFEESINGNEFDCLYVYMESQLGKRVYTIKFNA